MIKSAVTVSLVEEARGGPFVFWDGLADACQQAAALGFDAIEIFAPGPEAIDHGQLAGLLKQHNLQVAAVGTGAGMVKHGLALTSTDAGQRAQARDFVRGIIDMGGPYGAPAIIGSMQGRWGADLDRDEALKLLAEALSELGEHARQYNVPLIYEPLNRYETNLICTMSDGARFLADLGSDNVKLLADLFHMNIEETSVPQGVRDGGSYIGHVHFVDSNRRPAGMGHMDYEPIVEALAAINYQGYASAEAFPFPSPLEAARQTIETFHKFLKSD